MEIIKSLLYDYWKNIVIVILLILLCSCGSRKVENSRLFDKTDSINVDNSVILENNIHWSFSPIDSLKPFVIAGKKYENVIVKKDVINKKTNFDKKIITTRIKINETKKIEKSDYTILWALIAFIVVGAIFLWFYLPKMG